MSLAATVCREPGPRQYPGTITLWYGGPGHTGQPFHVITVVDPPANLAELAWLGAVLARLTPDGVIRCKPDLINAAFEIGDPDS